MDAGVVWIPLRLLWLLEHLRCELDNLALKQSFRFSVPLWWDISLGSLQVQNPLLTEKLATNLSFIRSEIHTGQVCLLLPIKVSKVRLRILQILNNLIRSAQSSSTWHWWCVFVLPSGSFTSVIRWIKHLSHFLNRDSSRWKVTLRKHVQMETCQWWGSTVGMPSPSRKIWCKEMLAESTMTFHKGTCSHGTCSRLSSPHCWRCPRRTPSQPSPQ